ncbi:MAG: hypothetical protein IPG04_38015 [Polyangiaceae bacterium]|nr:hypothetical protein [Polyangiaceae bacterium]
MKCWGGVWFMEEARFVRCVVGTGYTSTQAAAVYRWLRGAPWTFKRRLPREVRSG